jgi:hypothetical protein
VSTRLRLSHLVLISLSIVPLLGCVAPVGGWNTSQLEEYGATLGHHSGQRLDDTPPYFLPNGESALLFLCRFETQQPVRVSLPENATQNQLVGLRLALNGWSEAGLGLRFVEVPSAEANIDIRLVSGSADLNPKQQGNRGHAGYTTSDCQVDDHSDSASTFPGELPAALVHATVLLWPTRADMLGQPVPLSADEFVGVALHELGHALGFPGHLANDAGVMSKSTDVVRGYGRGLRKGLGFASPTLAALYALPSGIVLGRVAFAPGEAQVWERASQLARSSGWEGLFVRVGSSHASIFWRDGRRSRAVLRVPGYRDMLVANTSLRFGSGPFEKMLRSHSQPAE